MKIKILSVLFILSVNLFAQNDDSHLLKRSYWSVEAGMNALTPFQKPYADIYNYGLGSYGDLYITPQTTVNNYFFKGTYTYLFKHVKKSYFSLQAELGIQQFEVKQTATGYYSQGDLFWYYFSGTEKSTSDYQYITGTVGIDYNFPIGKKIIISNEFGLATEMLFHQSANTQYTGTSDYTYQYNDNQGYNPYLVVTDELSATYQLSRHFSVKGSVNIPIYCINSIWDFTTKDYVANLNSINTHLGLVWKINP